MTEHVQTPDKPMLIALAMCIFVAAIAALFWQIKQRADNSYVAMARGQYSLARHYYEEEVDSGSVQAMNHLANLHLLGLGTDKNIDVAAQLYLDASARGFGPAQLNLGHLYRQGIGVQKDALRAFGWYTMSDISGNPWAEIYLRQTAVEFTLTPNQIAQVNKNWPTLSAIVDEGL